MIDKHQYLHFDSYHASLSKTLIGYGKATRRSGFNVNINKRKGGVREKGYSGEIVNKETKPSNVCLSDIS